MIESTCNFILAARHFHDRFRRRSVSRPLIYIHPDACQSSIIFLAAYFNLALSRLERGASLGPVLGTWAPPCYPSSHTRTTPVVVSTKARCPCANFESTSHAPFAEALTPLPLRHRPAFLPHRRSHCRW
jgi:hypothetical protein